VCGVPVVNVRSEQLGHDCPARAHTLIELTPCLPMRSIGFGNQPVAHRPGNIAPEQFANGRERILLRQRLCKYSQTGQSPQQSCQGRRVSADSTRQRDASLRLGLCQRICNAKPCCRGNALRDPHALGDLHEHLLG
jgi:hypothetical protein